MDTNESETSVTVKSNVLNVLEKVSTDLFEKKLDELDFEQASILLGGLVMTITQLETSSVSDKERVVIDSELDGKEAVENYGMRLAEELAPHIDDERTLIINVVRNKTLWETIRNREPKVLKTFRFENEPTQHS